MTAVHLLHIDDEPDIREVVALSLGLDPGFAVRGCDSGEGGLAAAAEDIPDVILLDVMMPVMDGPTTLAHLRENPRTARVPVIFMTARVQNREIEQFKALGAAGVIAKPFDPMTLAVSVRRQMHAAADPLAAPRGGFFQRLSNDAEVLLQCWSGLGKDPDFAWLIRVRTIAHGLAGAGGIFGYPQISRAAARLEDAVTYGLSGKSEPQELERALERLLTSIGAVTPAQIEPQRRRLDA